ncbi:MAG: ABC transporter permease [Deltaproteobacteria bacterium]|nr:ABC transporter permease [Deltaproteobacteria bacterium]
MGEKAEKQGLMHYFKEYSWAVIITLILLVLWEGGVRVFDVPDFLLPPPSTIIVTLFDVYHLILPHVWVTISEAVVGLALAAILSTTMAFGIVYYKILERTLYPYAVITKVVPIISIAPLLTVWFGNGFLPKVLTAILVSFFPILVNTIAGLQSADRNMIRLMNSLYAPKFMIFTKIRYKYSLPYFFAGMRIASTLSVIGAIVGEFVGADRGIGFFLIMSMSELEVARVFMGVFFCTLIGLLLFFTVVVIEKYCIPWHVSLQGT